MSLIAKLLACITLLAASVIAAPVQETQDSIQSRVWTSADGKSTVEAELVSFTNGTVTLEKGNGSVLKVKTDDLSVADHYYIVETTGWGRIWESSDGKKVVADFLKSEGDSVTLQLIDGSFATVNENRFSKADQKYIHDRTGFNVRAEIALGKSLRGEVVGVSDGDTVTVLVKKTPIKVRLDGIDAPETGQAFGSVAKKFTSSLVFRKTVTLVPIETDKYGRVIGRVHSMGKDVSEELVKAGFAWHYKQYSDDELLANLESHAKKHSLGLWQETDPVPPWIWRKWGSAERQNWAIANLDEERERNALANLSPPAASQPVNPPRMQGSTGTSKAVGSNRGSSSTVETKSTSGGYWLNTKTGKRHNPGCRWYGSTSSGRACGPNDGSACKICGG